MEYSVEDLFRVKQKFLMALPHPKVFLKYINDLSAEKKTFDSFKIDAIKGIENFDIEHAIGNFLAKESQIKLSVANAKDVKSLSLSLSEYLLNLLSTLHVMAKYENGLEVPDDFKLSQPIPFYELSKILSGTNQYESILESLEKSLDYSKENPKFAVLLENILRAKLILDG